MIDLKLLKSEIERMAGLEDLTQDSNHRTCGAKSIYFNIARKNTRMSFTEIGMTIGVENHASVFSCIKKLPNYLRRFPELRSIYNFCSESEIFKNTEASKTRSVKDLVNTIEIYKKTNYQLVKELSELQDKYSQLQSKKTQERIEIQSQNPKTTLLELIEQVPTYHVETVRMRLEPMIKMLERPSIHNNLPRQ